MVTMDMIGNGIRRGVSTPVRRSQLVLASCDRSSKVLGILLENLVEFNRPRGFLESVDEEIYLSQLEFSKGRNLAKCL